MRIALVKRKCSLRIGGSERYCVLLARGLMKAGHQVTVIGESIDEDLKSEIDFKSVAVLKLSSSTKNRSFAINASKAISEGGYDISYALGRAYGVDAVRVTERIQSHWLNVNYRKSAWLQKWNPRHRTLIGLEREIYQSQSTKLIVTQSDLDRQLVIENYGVPKDKIHVVPNGVDSGEFKNQASKENIRKNLSISESDPILLFVGNDFGGKGLGLTIQALAKSSCVSLNLVIAGNGSERKYHKLAQKLGVTNRVHFIGHQSNMASIFSIADISILPTRYEPFPNVVLESLSCGTPVITMPTSGAAELIEEAQNGYLVSESQAVDELTGKLDQYFQQSHSQRCEMQRFAEESVKDYSLEKNIARTEELLQTVFVMKKQPRMEVA